MYHRLIEDYLTHYQPTLKMELEQTQTLQSYIDEQNATMVEARNRLLAQLRERHPTMSQTQRQMEADQTVREMYLPLN